MAETIGFVGLGAMGSAMARNLLRAGYGLRAYNRTRAKTEPLAAEGAILCETAAEAAEGVEIVITMLADDAALEQATLGDDGILDTLAPGGIHLSMSTVSPSIASRLAAQHDLHDSGYVAAPVFGRPEAAAAAKLYIVVSGEAAAKERVRPLLEVMGQSVFEFGPEVGAANVTKLCGNFLIAAAIEAMAEAYTLAEKNGVDRHAIHDMLTQTLFASPIYQSYGKRIADEVYLPVGFALPLGLKDARLVSDLGEASRTPLPLASLVRDRFVASLAKGREDLDWTGFAREASENAGIKRG
ncbi:MAG: NAD(P)-dependent oxidoreductase [Cytophagales bacterium]|nr:NAD(P)-dependent oxidoreductase [Armatimonadota bacterium]